ncbi:MAG: GNAT family N-acetyltransferase [Parcubacteria group bacterium]|nr:GNAT family N-acetyltransferase [Parcubacteria group bacterium]
MKFLLKGRDINLRKLKKSDAASLFRHAHDFDIAKYTSLPHPYTLQNAEDFIKKTYRKIRNKESIELGIEWKATREIIGMMSFVNIDFENKNAEIGYWVAKKYWGRNIMKEAVNLILNFGFQELKFVRIYAKVMHPNIASSKLLEKSGFQYEGRMRQVIFRHENWMDEFIYSILNTEFKPRV